MREYRSIAKVRGVRAGPKPGVTLQCIRPGVVDDYGSMWNPSAFDESLGQRLPTLCWAHDWSEPLGRGVAFQKSAQGPSVDFLFSDLNAVPAARRAYAQVQDGTIEDCSVGFSNARRRDPTDDELARFPGVTEVIEKATLDEVSLVLRGAVPGAKVLAVRDRRAAEYARLERETAEALALVDAVLRGDETGRRHHQARLRSL